MSAILHLLSPIGFGDKGGRSDDDFVDRLSHEVSCLLMIVMAVVVSTKQYVGDPINCWVPGHFTSNYAEYTNKVCWVSNTYYLPIDDPLTSTHTTPTRQISYYQWVPIALLLQAVTFYIPYLFWKNLSRRSGIDLNEIAESAKQLKNLETKEKALRHMLRQMDHYLGHYFRSRGLQRNGRFSKIKIFLSEKCHILCGKGYGNYLSSLYIGIKVIYFLNVIGQFFLLDSFLSTDFHMYGFRIMRSMFNNEDWPTAHIFPRETICDFKVRAMGNIHRHTVQCVLQINFFNEKIYVCIWFWLVFMVIATGCNLILWIARFVFKIDRIRYVKHYLRLMDKIRKSEDKKMVNKFVTDYLRQDGVLVLRLLNTNTNGLAVADLTAELWEIFIANPTICSKNKNEGEEMLDL